MGPTARAGAGTETPGRRRRMKVPTAKRAAFYLSACMKPHLAHQPEWQRRDDGQIWCRECETHIIGPQDIIDSGILMIPHAEREAVGNAIARWIRKLSPDNAKIIIPAPRRTK